MPYYLVNTTTTPGAWVSVANSSIGADVGDFIEFEGYADSGNEAGTYRLVGHSSGFDNFIALTSAEFKFRVATAEFLLTAGYTQPAVGELFKARLERTAAGEWTAFLNDVSLGAAASANNFSYDQFFRLALLTASSFIGGVKLITVKFGATTRVYDPSLSNGTGSTLPTNDGLNQGTLNSFPTDNSQWVEYGGPSLTITPADLPLIPGGTITGTYADYATIPTTLTVSDGTNTITIPTPTITDNGDGTGSFSGTMPALPTTGTANLVLFGDVTVELS